MRLSSYSQKTPPDKVDLTSQVGEDPSRVSSPQWGNNLVLFSVQLCTLRIVVEYQTFLENVSSCHFTWRTGDLQLGTAWAGLGATSQDSLTGDVKIRCDMTGVGLLPLVVIIT